MGNFETFIPSRERKPLSRSLFSGSIGPKGQNSHDDLRLVSRALANVGLLNADASPAETRLAIFRAIQHAHQTTSSDPVIKKHGDPTMHPGDSIEHAVRHAFAKGRFRMSHRIIAETTVAKEPRKVVYRGMQRALQKLNTQPEKNRFSSPYRRALLPSISMETFQTNRRLVEAITSTGDIPGLDILVSRTISERGKQGFADVQDFFRALRRADPAMADRVANQIYIHLRAKDLRRFRKLVINQPPTEADFN